MLMQYATQPCITMFHFSSLIPQGDITCVNIWSMAVATVHGHGPAKIGNYMDFEPGTIGISWQKSPCRQVSGQFCDSLNVVGVGTEIRNLPRISITACSR